MKRFVTALVAFVATVSLSHAESRQEEVDRRSLTTAVSRLVTGDRLAVKEASGTLWRGRFQSFEYPTASLILSDATAADGTVAEGQLVLRESAIEYVVLETRGSRYKGPLIGLGVGVAAAALAAQGCCGNPDYSPETAFLVLAPLFGGVGALIGYIVDDGSLTNEVLYSTEPPRSSLRWNIHPVVTRDSKGAVLSLSF